MPEEPPTNRNMGDGAGPAPSDNNSGTSIAQAGLRLGNTVVAALSPNFLALLIVNVLMLGLLYWFVDARARHTVEIVNKLLEACLKASGRS